MIRVEGHADNMEIGPSLKSRYPSNLELSKVRANGVLRYLLEKGGIEPERISAVALGDTKPTATNTVEEGRMRNRRVEILLYTPDGETPAPKPEVQSQVQKPEGRLSTVSARDDNDQPLPSTTSAMTDSPGRGAMAVDDSPQTPSKDRANPANNPDESGSTSTDTNKKGIPPQQPAAGTQTE
jgi:chemotaxis protein MotB